MQKLRPDSPNFSSIPFLRPGRYLDSDQTMTDADVGTIGVFNLSSPANSDPYVLRAHGNHYFIYFGFCAGRQCPSVGYSEWDYETSRIAVSGTTQSLSMRIPSGIDSDSSNYFRGVYIYV